MSISAPALDRRLAAIGRAPLTTALCLTLAASALFVFFPGLDLAVSSLFYNEAGGFQLTQVGLLKDLRDVGDEMPATIAVIVAAALLLKLIYPSRPTLLPPRFSLYYLSLYLLGPLLLVNGFLKAFSGRPRPRQILDFGGTLHFSRAWSFGGECVANCSFVSGEAAAAACLVPLALFVSRVWRKEVAVLITAFAAVTSLNRVAFGAHFLSDIVIAWGLVLTLAFLLRHIFYVSHASFFADNVLEARLTRLGRGLHDKVGRRVLALFGTPAAARQTD